MLVLKLAGCGALLDEGDVAVVVISERTRRGGMISVGESLTHDFAGGCWIADRRISRRRREGFWLVLLLLLLMPPADNMGIASTGTRKSEMDGISF
jgi:hypothetical protein